MTRLSDLPAQYAEALLGHITDPNEVGLNRAYELGRAALGSGLGVLDMATMHHQALGRLALGNAGRPQFSRAAEFFAESLSPFEMSLRGYQEANAHLAKTIQMLQSAKSAGEAANRELEAFSYSVAHDLRAPLRSIDGFSKALEEDYSAALDDQGRRYLASVRQSAQRMGLLIEDLLILSRVTRSEMRRQRVDLSRLARSVLDALQASQPDRQMEIALADGVVVDGDEGLLRVVLENLLGNAWKFTGKRADARIEFAVTQQSGEPVYVVRDNGAGFDMAYASKLFGTFQRLHSSTEFEGTGIGLATVQRIVTRHGGRVWALGEVDRGASLYFTLAPG
jgi:light-regulated signal transduction histidine kinase (bacteriophytochrome)